MMTERSEEGRTERVLVQVCLECGKEYTFVDEPPRGDMVCEKCGNRVFRSFYDDAEDEVSRDFVDETERDVRTDDPATDVTPGDIADLRNL
jgi:predicted  nucleic acid-binding Zn-ribbon protein